MYNISYFKERDFAVIKTFMKEHSFAIVTGCDQNMQPVATQVPLLLEEKADKLFLYGHFQRKTDHHLALEKNPKVLVLFTGAHAYVSASLYTQQESASTWNYMTVHAKGLIQFLDDAALLSIISKTTAHYENNIHSPSLVEKMPVEYVEKMMKAIVGFEIEITGIDNVFKLES